MKIALGCDHGGYAMKEDIKKQLEGLGHEVKDCGTYSTESCDYPIFGEAAARAVASGECEYGIVVGTTGIGISIAANKVKGIRCAHCADALEAQLCKSSCVSRARIPTNSGVCASVPTVTISPPSSR